ncbi:hypothetical protein BGX26_012466 [Mortierella sp. AD094]|nr:hypothetical protein BGX26_012466 [Mortierella sp. AD094]
MADRTTTSHAKETTTARAVKPTGSGVPAPDKTSTRAATRTNTRSGATTTAAIINGTTASPTPTIAPAPSGPSGALIGGIAGGVAVLLAIVGLLCYKRRRRATVAVAAAKGVKGGDPKAPRSVNAAISGPMSLAPDNGIKAAPPHRPEAQFREQQQFKPGMRDELFAQPGSAIHKNLTAKENNKPPGAGNQGNANNRMNEKDLYSGNRQESPTDSYEDTLVNDYYGGADHVKESETIGAQRPAPQPKDVLRGNLTPAPEYYMGKEDIDPRRDLRGLDAPETYVKSPTSAPNVNHGRSSDSSPRSSYSSDRDSAYLTLEQAQQAHNHKMMGHKQSISSIDMLIVDHSSKGRTNQTPDHLLSVAMTESTMSMMPSLPPTTSPAPFNGVKHQNGLYDPRMQQHGPPSRGPNPGPISAGVREDPYAESAFSEDFRDDRSMASGSYYNPNYAQQKQQQQQQQQYPHSGGQSPSGYYSPGGQGGPYSPQPLSPPYRQNQPPYPQQYQGQQQGYSNNYNNNNNNMPYPNNRPQQPPQSGPGFQRDGPYQRQY